MSKYITNKFGKDFRANLYNDADSLFALNVSNQNQIVDSWNCDQGPLGPNQLKPGDYNVTYYVDSLNIPLYSDGTFLFDISFIIELNGIIHDFQVENKVIEPEGDGVSFPQLKDYAIEELKKEGRWRPGILGGEVVKTREYVRVYISLKN